MTVRLPSRGSEMLAVACAVAVGAALVAFCLVMAESGLRSAVPAERFAGVDILIGGDQTVRQDEDFDLVLPDPVGVPVDLAPAVAEIPGVRAVAIDVGFPAAVADGRGGVVPVESVRRNGHGWDAFLGTVGLIGAPPIGPDDVVLAVDAADAVGVSPGDPVQVLLRGEVRDMRVSGVADLRGGGVFVSDALARDLGGRPDGVVDLLSVVLHDDADIGSVTDRVEALVDGRGLVVAAGDDIGRVERPAAAAGAGMLLAFALSAGGVVVTLVGFITAGAVSVGVAGRSRELALLRAVGATPAQIRSMTARQITGVALGSTIVGIAAGMLGAAAATGPLVDLGLLARGQSLSWSPVPALATGLLMLGVVQVAARTGSFRLSRMSPADAMVETEAEPRSANSVRTPVGSIVLALAAGSAIVPLVTRSEAAVMGAASGTLLAVIGVALIAPAVVGRLGGWLAARSGPASRWLAVRNSGSYAVRTGGTVSVLALAVGLLTTQVYVGSTVSAAVDQEVREGTVADVLVSAPAAGGVSSATVAAIADDPSVVAAVPMVGSTVMRPVDEHGVALVETYPMSVVGSGIDGVLDLGVVDGDLSRLDNNSVAIDSATARSSGIDVGHTVSLILPDGTAVEPTVVAIYARGFGFGKIVASFELLSQGASGPYDSVLISGRTPGVAADLDDLISVAPGLRIDDATAALVGPVSQDPARVLNLGISVVLMGYILLAVANRLVATTLRRRREWQLLRAVGATPRQLRTMARTETVLVCVGAIAVGLVISLGPMSVLAFGFVGKPWPQGPWWPVAGTVFVVCVVAYAATMLPVRRLLHGASIPQPPG
ncbi:FtsX-like permease family protein [Rhodococcus sp. NPDC058639]|uniref:FtsX-like permease family protein n=1 Tax=Rhodococcus sp. NPDC058639 TaxID=3346570 RepID=UPI00364F74DC